MSQQSFKEIEHEAWTSKSPAYDDWFAPIIIDHQAPDARERIKASVVQRAEAFRKGDTIELRSSYLLVAATKPA